ncbi:MAG: hypothetical protein OCD01_11165 [Fibrobacterales bacterium]
MTKMLLMSVLLCGSIYAEAEKTPMEASEAKEPKDKPIILLWPNFEYDTRSSETDMEIFVAVLGYRKVFDNGVKAEVSFRVDKDKEGSNKATMNSAYITSEPLDKAKLYVGLQPSLTWFTRLLFYFKAHAKEYPTSLTGTRDGTGDLDVGVTMKYQFTDEFFMHGGALSGNNRQGIDTKKQDFVYALNTEYRGAFWAVNLYTSIRPFNGNDSLFMGIPGVDQLGHATQIERKPQILVSPFGCIGTPWAKLGLMYSYMQNSELYDVVKVFEVNLAIPVNETFEFFGRYVDMDMTWVQHLKDVNSTLTAIGSPLPMPKNGIYAKAYSFGVEYKQTKNLGYALKWEHVDSNEPSFDGQKIGLYGNFVY